MSPKNIDDAQSLEANLEEKSLEVEILQEKASRVEYSCINGLKVSHHSCLVLWVGKGLLKNRKYSKAGIATLTRSINLTWPQFVYYYDVWSSSDSSKPFPYCYVELRMFYLFVMITQSSPKAEIALS